MKPITAADRSARGAADVGAAIVGSAQAPASFVSTLARLADGGDLTKEEAGSALEQIMAGDANDVQAAAFLMALRVKGETADEIAGLAETMRRMAVRVPAL